MADVLELLAAASRAQMREVQIEGTVFHLRILSGDERDQWDSYLRSVKHDEDPTQPKAPVFATLLEMVLANQDGTRACGAGGADKIRSIASYKVLNTLFDAAIEHNLLGTAGVEEAKKSSASDPPNSPG